ncbi:MAG: UDP-N-acetylmuramoyl-L-alanine--D-glutamate ligase [Hyphomicrobiaceae bacterium]
MIPVTTFAGKSVAVFGLGGSGIATARALVAGGAIVAAWDDGDAGRAAAEKAGIPLVDLTAADWTTFAALVLAPGVPLTHPEPHWTVHKAIAAKIEIIGDIELFCRERNAHCPDAPFIAITGTNGKSTTTSLIAHILRNAGMDVQMGGNIGVPILALEPPAGASGSTPERQNKADRIYVIEMSSFQIDLTPSLNPTVGVLLNITPDHIDRHGTVENYAAVKERLVTRSTQRVVGGDPARAMGLVARVFQFNPTGTVRPARQVYQFKHPKHWEYQYEAGQVKRGQPPKVIADFSDVATLRGIHNAENAAAAFAACSAIGLDDVTIAQHIRTYPGLAHRLEEIGRIGNVLLINDSKATNADSTEKALLSFPDDVYWILGGKPKEGGIEPLVPLFSRVAKAYLIGAATEEFAQTLEGHVPYARCGVLDIAVAKAVADAKKSGTPNPVVLLSPACASYDQFKSFEHRGDAFRALVSALPGFTPRGKA